MQEQLAPWGFLFVTLPSVALLLMGQWGQRALVDEAFPKGREEPGVRLYTFIPTQGMLRQDDH